MIRAMGEKGGAKALMERAGVPVVPGTHGNDQRPSRLRRAAERIGYPVVIKPVAGGGGKGMRVIQKAVDFNDALRASRREAKSAFGDARVLIEKWIARPRHVEIQIFADSHGAVVHLFERDCSIQRHHQKVIEEAPAPRIGEGLPAALYEAAVAAARAIGYVGAGTVEFIVDARARAYYFMEMNTRFQVEHPVTEMVVGHDLVEWQLRVAEGEPLPHEQDSLARRGHAIEARLYAEDAVRDFIPQAGRLHRFRMPAEDLHLRIDTGYAQGDAVGVDYDPLIAKVIAWDHDRPAAILRLARHRRALLARSQTDAELVLAIACLDTLLRRRAAAAAAARASSDSHSPWFRVDGWRLNGTRSDLVHLCYQGSEVAIHAAEHAAGGVQRD